MTFREALSFGKEFLARHSIETPLLDATVLLSEAANMPKEMIYSSFPDILAGATERTYRRLLEKRSTGYPVSYIRNKKEFYSRTFYVDERVLVPRPDTEIIIDTALELIEARTDRSPAEILDLGTGSGCIAITLALECRERNLPARITAADVSRQAGEVFAINTEALSPGQVRFIHSDLFDKLTSRFDIIVSNPPYLTSEETGRMSEAHWPEPLLALEAGEEGLDILDKIVHDSVDYLKRNGYLLLEAHQAQMPELETALKKRGYANIEKRLDLAGRERVILGRSPG